MSDYEELKKLLTKKLDEVRCQTCQGRGKLNDAEPGDMYANEWECPDCNGSGIILGTIPAEDKP